LDAFDKDLLITWANEGKLPTLHKMLNGQTAAGLISNPVGTIAGAVWPCFMSACSPAVHGRYWWQQLKSGSYDVVNSFTAIDVPAFWETLASRGVSAAVVDVPFMPLHDDIDGIQVRNWSGHDLTGPLATHPPALKEQLTQRYGCDEIGACDRFMKACGNDLGLLVEGLSKRIERKTHFCQELLKDRSHDFFAVVFGESHCVGHHGWRLHDPFHPGYDSAERERVGDPIERVYQKLDAAVGELMQSIEADTNVIVFASHGMGPKYHAEHLCDQILCGIESGRLGPYKSWAIRRARSLFKPVLRRRGKTCIHRGRRFFQVPNCGPFGGVRVNLEGREPNGIVPVAEVESTLDYLERELSAVMNVATGKPAVRALHRSAKLFQGPRLAELPDLFIEWESTAPIVQVHSPRFGTTRRNKVEQRSGDHKCHGMYLARGPQVAYGQTESEISMMDLGPTICALLGVGLSAVDGRAAKFAQTPKERAA
jgi:predicted AlkP superfamily phosphohydrolase/phosphomutase